MEWKAVVDRFENDIAILYLVQTDDAEDDVWFQIPKTLLPSDVKEGDYLVTTWQIDHQSTEQARKRVTSLIDRLVNREHDD